MTAAGLAELHQCGVGYGEEVTWEDELMKIYKQRAKLAGPLPQFATAAEELLNHLQTIAAAQPADAAAPAHRSFRPAQVLLAGGEIGFIDFDGFCQAEPALDVALFMATVKNLGMNKAGAGDEEEDEDEQLPLDDTKRLAGLRLAEAICDLFLTEYEKHAPVSRTRILLWEALGLLVVGIWNLDQAQARARGQLPLTFGKASVMRNVHEILLGEHGLEGVQALLVGVPAQEMLHEVLAGMLAEGFRIGVCRLQRAKFKPRRKLVAYYDAVVYKDAVHTDAAAAGAGSFSRGIAVTWSMAAPAAPEPTAPAFPFARLAAAVAGSAEGGPWGLQIVVSPHDAAYPQLRRLVDPAYVRTLAGTYAAPAAAAYVVSTVRYRPGQRHVLRYSPAEGEARGGPGALFAKLYAPAQYPPTRGQAFCALSHRLADWLEACVPGATVLRPAAFVAEDTAILYPWVPGVPLAEMEGRRAAVDAGGGEQDGVPAQALAATGAALAALHAAPPAVTGELPHQELAGEIAAIARTCEHIQVLLPPAGRTIQALLAAGRRGLCGAAAGSCHLYPRRFQGRPCAGDAGRAADPDRFRRLRAGGSGVRHRQVPGRSRLGVCRLPGAAIWRQRERPFSGATGCLPGHPRLQRAQVVAALILLKIAAHRVKLFDPTWAAQTGALVARAEALLG